MLSLLVLLIGAILLGALAIYVDRKLSYDYDWIVILSSIVAGSLAFLLLVGMLDIWIWVPREIAVYTLYKENYVPIVENGIDFPATEATMNKNLWLYKAQASRMVLGDFSHYPASVLELSPIK